MSGMEMVPLQQAWLPEIMKIESEAFGEDAWSPESFRQGMEQLAAHYVAICQNEKLLGYMGFLHVVDEIELLTIAVANAARRKGAGRQMMAFLLNYAKDHNVERILLEVRASNRAAIALYESLKFQKIGVRKSYYRKPKEDALIYEWTGVGEDAVDSPV